MGHSLRSRMILSLGFMVLGSLAIGGGAMLAVNGLHQDLGIAVQGYRQLRQLFDVGFLSSRARDAISANPPRPLEAQAALRSAMSMLNNRSLPGAVEGPPPRWIDESARVDCQHLLSDSVREIDITRSPASLDLLFARLSKVSDHVRASISDAQLAADRRRQLSLEAVLTLSLIVIVGTVILGVGQYRRVIGPIRRIGLGVREFATGDFDRRIKLTGDREFIALASDFNHMADQLSALYRDLEQQVLRKSHELVRSERLASVGYLAAGVAHEINNPLGIIAGYAQRALQQMEASQDFDKTRKALMVICEESFRCKQITDRLLSLARPGEKVRQVVSLATITEQVIATIAGLGSAYASTLSITSNGGDLTVLASEGEIKQVVLNLVINAMQATNQNAGKIKLVINRHEDYIELSVIDNGQGMTPQTLEHVFEPFFSLKKGERSGTGLGLSIAYAIIADHGGQLRARSDGPGLGSTFTVTLPPARKVLPDAAN